MATDKEIHDQLQQTNAERQLLELQMESQRYKRLRTVSATREQPKRKPKVNSPDRIVFTGLEGTLGRRTLSVGNDVELNSWKSKCIAYLSRNVIVDFTNKTQLKLIGVTLNQLNNRFKLVVEGAERDIKLLDDACKKINNHIVAKNCLAMVESYDYADNKERGIKMIYVHILDQIVNKPVLFTKASQQQFSEMAFLVKFWGPVIELFFDANQYCVQWGDTTSPHLSLSNLYFNLDFRVIVKDINTEDLDVVTGELARQSSTTPSKVYCDFLKSALATKVHLNVALKRMPYISSSKIKAVIAPMLQIMGLSCVIYGMNIIDKKVYSLQRISSFNYPSTLREVKGGAIKEMSDGFALVQSMITNIETMIIEYNRAPSHAMPNIKNGRKKNANVKMIDIEQYISPVSPCPDSGNLDEEDEQDDEDCYDEED